MKRILFPGKYVIFVRVTSFGKLLENVEISVPWGLQHDFDVSICHTRVLLQGSRPPPMHPLFL